MKRVPCLIISLALIFLAGCNESSQPLGSMENAPTSVQSSPTLPREENGSIPMPTVSSQMAGDYEILHAIPIGKMEVVFGHYPEDKNFPFMVATCQSNDIMMRYDGVMIGDDYAEMMTLFSQYLHDEAERIQQEAAKELEVVGHNGVYNDYSCKETDGIELVNSKHDLNGKVIIIDPDVLKPEYKRATRQLLLCTGGFGASPNSRGSSCFCTNLYTGQSTRFERRDLY